MSSAPLPNKSEFDRISVDSSVKQSGSGAEGTVDRLNEALNVDDCTRYLRGISGRFKPENPDELEICRLALAAGASKTLRAYSDL